MEELRYLRRERLPHLWCPGCGHGTVLRAIVLAMARLGLDQDRVAVVSGIGCSSRAVGYLNMDALHTTHGRALAFATGLKLARPDLKVVVLAGDGDLAAIGGNHLIHAARRNIGITCICFNNSIYGMTSGQYSPLTPRGMKATTAPYGHLERDFDLCRVVQAAGATYVARSTAYHVHHTIEYVTRALSHEGFSFVEVLSQCPTYLGRRNGMADAVDLLNWYRRRSVTVSQARSMSTEELRDRVVIGEFQRDDSVPEYTRSYLELIARVASEDATDRHSGEALGEPKATEYPRAERGPGAARGPVRWEVRLAGSGGQGMITAGIILADAAVRAGWNVTQTQSYGPESRGGAARAEVIISDGEIDYPRVTRPDVLLVMTEEACRRYASDVRQGGLVIADEGLIGAVPEGPYRVVRLPILRIARETVGKEIVANIVALGVLASVTQVVPFDALEAAVLARVPRHTRDMNRAALQAGVDAGLRVTT